MSQQNLARSRSLPPKVLTRRIQLPLTELRFAGGTEGKPFTFSGYAVRWNSINTHGEQFVRGAFADLISSGKKVHMYYNHAYLDYCPQTAPYRIGKWLSLVEDDEGLSVSGELTPDLALANDIKAMLKHGTIDGLSIAFYAPTELDYEYVNDVLRFKRVDVYEISVVDEPSDRQARIDPTDQEIDAVANSRDAAALLQQVGMSPRGAEALLSRLTQLIKPVTTEAEDFDSFAFLDDLS